LLIVNFIDELLCNCLKYILWLVKRPAVQPLFTDGCLTDHKAMLCTRLLCLCTGWTA